MKVVTILFCLREGQVLLGMKKRGFGEGKWNGFGGKVQEGETIEEATVREMREESGIEVAQENLRKVAHLTFCFADGSVFDGHAFMAETWQGEPAETDEMSPRWFPLTEIPWESMWRDDPLWLPHVLNGRTVRFTCHFDETGEEVARFELSDASFA